MKSRNKGFTLIELVVVIIILGILGAVALPKLINIQGDARMAVMRNVEGSMRAANALLYAKASILSRTGATGFLTSGELGVSTGPGNPNVTLVRGYATNVVELGKVMDLTPAADFDVGVTAALQLRHAKATATTPPGTSCRINYVAATATAAPQYNQTNLTNCN